MRSRTVGWLRLVLFGVAVSSCNDSTNPGPPCSDPDGGTFVGMSQGAAVRGCATYAVASSSGSPNTVLLVSVGPQAAPTILVSLVRVGDRPTVGSYPIGPNAGDFGGAVQVNPGGAYSIVSGNVTVDAFVNGELQGSFGITATQSGSGASITVSGLFTAVCTPGGSVTC